MDDRYEYERNAEIRQHLADARASRGSKRKKSVKARRKGTKQQYRETRATGHIATQVQTALPARDVKKAHKLLDKFFPNKNSDVAPFAFWRTVAGLPGKFSVRKHRREYVRALQPVLAAIEIMIAAGRRIEIHINAIAELTGIPTTSKKFDIFKLVLMLMLDYRKKDGSENLDSRDLSRDAAALRYVVSQGVRSYGLLKFPGGVDKWSRLASKNAQTAADERSDRDKEVEKDDESEEIKKYLNKAVDDSYYDDIDEAGIGKRQTLSNFADLCNCSTPRACMSRHIASDFDLEFGDRLLMVFNGGRGKRTPWLSKVMKITHRGAPGQKMIFDREILSALAEAAEAAGSKVKDLDRLI